MLKDEPNKKYSRKRTPKDTAESAGALLSATCHTGDGGDHLTK